MKRGIIAFALSMLLLAACGTGQEDAPDEHTPEVVPQAAVDMAEEYAENLAGDWSERGESEGWASPAGTGAAAPCCTPGA